MKFNGFLFPKKRARERALIALLAQAKPKKGWAWPMHVEHLEAASCINTPTRAVMFRRPPRKNDKNKTYEKPDLS
jgi:hypothetical protein